ncbi:unnamed protein product [Onchocerca flexuosa]|uniref:Secreted protein n=1 Tax=Onchocerca flexuosa TaxID=387005 RepID=A0A183HRF0_9BILA|nr:unnamed protein product [Onchocerca flexuosa]
MATSLFAARSAFLPTLGKVSFAFCRFEAWYVILLQGKYGCMLVEQTFEGPFALIEYQNLALNISAIWNRAGKVCTIQYIFSFFIPFYCYFSF